MNIDKQLVHAVEAGNLEKVKFLVASGTDVNYMHYHYRHTNHDFLRMVVVILL